MAGQGHLPRALAKLVLVTFCLVDCSSALALVEIDANGKVMRAGAAEARSGRQRGPDDEARSGRQRGPDDEARSGRQRGPDDAARSGRQRGPDDEAPADPNCTVPGDLYVEPSTLHSLGFEWRILGDENRNGRVAVRYRRAGRFRWEEGHDLLRIQRERVAETRKEWAYVCGNLYAGSVLFLEPDTVYDVILKMSDPDNGQRPVAVKRFRVETKSEPRLFEGGRRLHVYPGDHAGEELEPNFPGFTAAYDAARPGDQILLHAGEYGGNYVLTKKGTREMPIAIRDAGDGEVVFEGGGVLFDVSDAHYHWFEGLVMRGHGGGTILCRSEGTTKGLTVRHCRFEDHGNGVLLRARACRDVYVADNVFVGTTGTWHRGPYKREPYKAVWVAGQGVDVCHNRVRNHWDGVSVHQPTGLPSERFEENMVAIDFYNNDIGQTVDDNEADGGAHNIRFFNNRIVDMHVGLSAQPVYGGPCYFVRNVLYNITRGLILKLHTRPAGVCAYNNTFFSYGKIASSGVANCGWDWWNTHIHNNLFLGINGPTLLAGPLDPDVSTLDYNGYSLVDPIVWYVPAGGGMRVDGSVKTFADLAKLGFEGHMVQVSFDDFVDVAPPRGEAGDTPLDFGDARLREGSSAIDAGMVIPNVTDGFRGEAPDLGAYEFGEPPPHYGPRPRRP